MYDNYHIEQQWLELRKLLKEVDELDSDLYSFIGRKNKSASKRLRKNFLTIHKIALALRKDILYQRKENISNYEDY